MEPEVARRSSGIKVDREIVVHTSDRSRSRDGKLIAFPRSLISIIWSMSGQAQHGTKPEPRRADTPPVRLSRSGGRSGGQFRELLGETGRETDLLDMLEFLRRTPPPDNYMSIPDNLSVSSAEDEKWRSKFKVFRSKRKARRKRRKTPIIRLPDTAIAGQTTGGHRHIAISIPLEYTHFGPNPPTQYPVFDTSGLDLVREIEARFGPIRTSTGERGTVTVLRPVEEDRESFISEPTSQSHNSSIPQDRPSALHAPPPPRQGQPSPPAQQRSSIKDFGQSKHTPSSDRISLHRRRERRTQREQDRRAREIAQASSEQLSQQQQQAPQASDMPSRERDLMRKYDELREQRHRDMEKRLRRLERNGDVWIQSLVPLMEGLSRLLQEQYLYQRNVNSRMSFTEAEGGVAAPAASSEQATERAFSPREEQFYQNLPLRMQTTRSHDVPFQRVRPSSVMAIPSSISEYQQEARTSRPRPHSIQIPDPRSSSAAQGHLGAGGSRSRGSSAGTPLTARRISPLQAEFERELAARRAREARDEELDARIAELEEQQRRYQRERQSRRQGRVYRTGRGEEEEEGGSDGNSSGGGSDERERLALASEEALIGGLHSSSRRPRREQYRQEARRREEEEEDARFALF
ncbi:hypothetical protein PG993_006693 [Apiospora rasikravindrae]|uniref:Uncharacterized protein n=1 Tax=Apiospora rasikravindrae TaxID=990691 RepID=A0ABR1T860_9PEZI